MKKETGSKIPEAYWQTEAGQKIAAAMHSDGWDASDCLGSVIDLLDEGIAATKDTVIAGELKKARQQVTAARNAYWRASAILRDCVF